MQKWFVLAYLFWQPTCLHRTWIIAKYRSRMIFTLTFLWPLSYDIWKISIAIHSMSDFQSHPSLFLLWKCLTWKCPYVQSGCIHQNLLTTSLQWAIKFYSNFTNVMRCAIWYYLYNLKKREKNPCRSVNFSKVARFKINTPPWVFFTFFKL